MRIQMDSDLNDENNKAVLAHRSSPDKDFNFKI
jgi:hypothetical protein